VQGAKVVVTDTLCGEEEPVVRIFSTSEEGGLDDPGLPVGTYDICVSDGSKHVSFAGLDLPEDPAKPAAGSALDVYLGNPEAEVGACP
jgi:hypothetical protein